MSTTIQPSSIGTPPTTPKPHKKPSTWEVVRTVLIVIIVIIIIAIIVIIAYSWYNSTNVSPININKKYYIISDDGSLPPFPTYLNASKTSLYLSIIPDTTWSFDPVGNGTTVITDNRGIKLKSSNGYMSDGSTSTPPTTSPTLMISDTGVAFTVSPKDTTDTGSTNKLYKLTSDINILYNNGNVPELINLDNCNSSTCTTYWWRFANSL